MTGLVLVILVVLAITAFSLWALVDSALQPAQAYTELGLNRGLVTAMLVLTCVFGAVAYFLLLRPRLLRAVGRSR